MIRHAFGSWLLASVLFGFLVAGFFRSPDHRITRSCDLFLPSRGDTISPTMSRKPALIKVVNLEEGMPKVEQARLRMEHELHAARAGGYKAVKLIHGYGSSGAGGVLRTELQKALRLAAHNRTIQAVIAGEDWGISNETTWELLKRFPEWKQDPDLGRNNPGISVVVL
jgi:hypothetical protein